jgi:diguanylate cyclase (GGDEF)-like protein/PAS domain S-box-containing protein
MQTAFGGVIGGPQPLRVADLISLAALPALVIALATLTAGLGRDDLAEREPPRAARGGRGRPMLGLAGRVPSWPVLGMAVDSALLVAALFVICYVTVFGRDYQGTTAGPAAFAVDLIRPAADLIAIGLVLRFVMRSPRMTVLPALALVVVTAGDCLAVGPRVSGTAAGLMTGLAVIAALCLLGAAGLLAAGGLRGAAARADRAGPEPAAAAGSWSNAATLIAISAAALAAVGVTVVSVSGGPVASPALAVAGAAMVLLLVIRLALLAQQASAAAATAHDPDRAFLVLADSAIDAIVLCDTSGMIEYASRSVAEFGYEPGQIAGARLIDLVHPEDRRTAAAAALSALSGLSGNGDGEVTGPVTFSGRVRGADGSWRHVESGLSRYLQPGGQARLLVTARDVSDRVALRRQVAHLTFHDSLTGLPNRAYLEERLADLCRHPARAGSVIGAIVIDLDGYAAVNNVVGRSGGDLILAQAGRRLRAAAPPEAIVARWGSDAFAVLTGEARSAAEIIELARHLADRVAAEPFSASDTEIPLTASIGVAAGRAELVLSDAHLAMSRAKDAGGNRVEIFAPPMSARPVQAGPVQAGTVTAEH